jgi:hypothetical protein
MEYQHGLEGRGMSGSADEGCGEAMRTGLRLLGAEWDGKAGRGAWQIGLIGALGWALQPDVAAVGFHKRLGDGEAQAASASLA